MKSIKNNKVTRNFVLTFLKGGYKTDYFYQGITSISSILTAGYGFYLLSGINFYLIGFFAFQTIVASITLNLIGNYFAFAATRKKNIKKYSLGLIILQIISILFLFISVLFLKAFLEGKFNLQFPFSISLIMLIGIRKTFYLLQVDSSINKKNYLISFINFLETLVFLILLLSLKVSNSNLYFSNKEYITQLVIRFKEISNFISVILSTYLTLKLIKKTKISLKFLKAKTLLMMIKGFKFVPYNFITRVSKSSSILISAFLDDNLLSIVAMVEKINNGQIIFDGILRKSGINKIRKGIPKNNFKGLKIFVTSILISFLAFPFLLLIIRNSQNQNIVDINYYYFIISFGIALRGFSWFSNSLLAKHSVGKFGYISSFIGLTNPLIFLIIKNLPFNFSLLISLGLSNLITILILIFTWDYIRRHFINNENTYIKIKV